MMTVSDFVTRNTVPGSLEAIIQRLRADREFAQGNLEYEQEALLAAETCEEFFRHRLEVEHWKTRIEVLDNILEELKAIDDSEASE